MNTVNALIAFNSNQVENFLDNFRFDVTSNPEGGLPIHARKRIDFAPFETTGDRPVTLDPYNLRHLLVNLQSDGMWKPYVQGGPVTTIMVNMQMVDTPQPDVDAPEDMKISMIEYLRNFFDGRYQVIGVWKIDGILHGQTLVPATYDENGDELTPEEITGKATYPLNPNYLGWMPDDVVYDEQGNELSRTDATEFKQVNQTSGWANRRM